MSESLSLFHAVVLGIVEGLTEFLPVSSTGHLIVAGEALGLEGEKTATFEIFIQLGAILAVVWDRRETLLRSSTRLRLGGLTLLAFLPAAGLGFLLHGLIKQELFSSRVVAWSLILGAIAIWVIEGRKRAPSIEGLEALSARHALAIGLFQCLALVPGVSRAAATILGGLLLGLSRPVATEFSFLLAIPTIGAATLYDLLKSRGALSAADIPSFAVGFAVSLLVALAVVRWLMGYVRRHDFRPFAVWRLGLGVIVLLWLGQAAL